MSFLKVSLFAVLMLAAIVGGGIAEWQRYKSPLSSDDRSEQITITILSYVAGVNGIMTIIVTLSWIFARVVSRGAAMFVLLILSLFTYLNTLCLLSLLLPLRLLPDQAAFWLVTCFITWLNLAVYLHALSLSRPRLRPKPYLYLISYPSTVYFSFILLSIPFLWAIKLIVSSWASLILLLPALLSLLGLWQSLTDKLEIFDIDLRPSVSFPTLRRLPHQQSKDEGASLLNSEEGRGGGGGGGFEDEGSRLGSSLKIVQITDPHLGSFVSVSRLRSLCQQVATQKPDLVLLTGDFFTLEGERSPGALAEALSPLRPLQGRLFACLGNHDVESKAAREATDRELNDAGVTLLVNEEAFVDIPGKGRVQVVGVDFFPRKTRSKAKEVCRQLPRREDCPMRIVMLHDPAGFSILDPEDGGLVFSGHTHGGQIGLVSLGLLDWTISGLVGPANGYWGLGKNRHYIGRGQGCRFLFGNFLVRLGVPPETSVITFKW